MRQKNPTRCYGLSAALRLWSGVLCVYHLGRMGAVPPHHALLTVAAAVRREGVPRRTVWVGGRVYGVTSICTAAGDVVGRTQHVALVIGKA